MRHRFARHIPMIVSIACLILSLVIVLVGHNQAAPRTVIRVATPTATAYVGPIIVAQDGIVRWNPAQQPSVLMELQPGTNGVLNIFGLPDDVGHELTDGCAGSCEIVDWALRMAYRFTTVGGGAQSIGLVRMAGNQLVLLVQAANPLAKLDVLAQAEPLSPAQPSPI